MNRARSNASTSRILLKRCTFLIFDFLKSSGLKESKSLVMDFTKYAEQKLSITYVALSTAAIEGSTKQKCLILGDIFFECRKSNKHTEAVP